MSKDLNQITLIGRLTRDSEMAYTNGGTAHCNCSLAYTRSVKKGESWEDKSCFIEFTLWGRRAEGLREYLTKGQRIGITGELDLEMWEKDGVKRSKHKIVVENVQLLGGNRDNQQSAPTQEAGAVW